MYKEPKTKLQKIGLGLPVDDKGVEPNVARSSEDWRDFRLYHKKHNPIRYFFNEDFESIFIWPWSMRLERVWDWIRYRTIHRYHVVNTGMEPGYTDLTEKLIHVNFNMLKEFVEIEKARMYGWAENSIEGLKGADAGVAYLLWEMGLDADNKFENQQSENAREIYELYDWWTNQRPYREDIDHLWEPYHKLKNEIYGDDDCYFCQDKDTPELKKLQKKWLKESTRLEKKHTKEDEKMLIRLIKIRGALWT